MITNTELTCINCPLGCALTVASENGSVLSVTGNTCQRGEAYARAEYHCPRAHRNHLRPCRRRQLPNGQRKNRFRHSKGQNL